MSIAANKALCRRVVEEIFNQGQFDAVADVFSAGYVDRSDPPGTPAGVEGVKQRLMMFRTAFPDARVVIEDLVAEGDKVAARFTFYGTHSGELMGIPPTGKSVAVTGSDINRIADGKIAERWANFDTLGLMQQLGAMPAPEGVE